MINEQPFPASTFLRGFTSWNIVIIVVMCAVSYANYAMFKQRVLDFEVQSNFRDDLQDKGLEEVKARNDTVVRLEVNMTNLADKVERLSIHVEKVLLRLE